MTETAEVEPAAVEEPEVEAPEEPEVPEGFGVDTCDGEGLRFQGKSLGVCSMRAWVWVTMPSGKMLTFCGHHANKYMPSLAAQGANVVDMTHMILETY